MSEHCAYHATLDYVERYYLIAYFGSSVALIAVIENLLIFFALIVHGHGRGGSHVIYLILMAPCDVFVCISYLLLFSVEIAVEFWRLVPLQTAWWFYFRLVYMGSHFSLTAGTFLLMAASFERYIVTCKPHYVKPIQRNRVPICCTVIILAFLLKFSSYYEFELRPNDVTFNGVANCSGLTQYYVTPSELLQPGTGFNGTNSLQYKFYAVAFRLYLRQIVSRIAPFLALAYFNVMIILKFLYHHKTAQLFRTGSSEHKIRARAATRMLFIIVCSYLLANVPNMVLIFWEYVDYDSLINSHAVFYVWMADAVSLCHVLFAAVRLPIYIVYNRQIRAAVCCRSSPLARPFSSVYDPHLNRPPPPLIGDRQKLRWWRQDRTDKRDSVNLSISLSDSVNSEKSVDQRAGVDQTLQSLCNNATADIQLVIDEQVLSPGDIIPVQVRWTRL